ncbi:hypothetical protein AB0K60_36750 [Thermopolyspora sp. NPDC052614]
MKKLTRAQRLAHRAKRRLLKSRRLQAEQKARRERRERKGG